MAAEAHSTATLRLSVGDLRIVHPITVPTGPVAAADVVPALQAAAVLGQRFELATLREPVDAFFEAVLVNADDAEVRANRYALLAQLRGLFLGVADISLLG